MAKKQILSSDDLAKLSKLANLPISGTQAASLQEGVEATLEYAKVLGSVDVSKLAETREVTNLHNVWREDVIDESRILTQEEALMNAPATHDGYFMVKAVFEEE